MAAEGAILNEMLEIVAKRQSLRPSPDTKATAAAVAAVAAGAASSPFTNPTGRKPNDTDVSIARLFPFPLLTRSPLLLWSLLAGCLAVAVLAIAVTLTS